MHCSPVQLDLERDSTFQSGELPSLGLYGIFCIKVFLEKEQGRGKHRLIRDGCERLVSLSM